MSRVRFFDHPAAAQDVPQRRLAPAEPESYPCTVCGAHNASWGVWGRWYCTAHLPPEQAAQLAEARKRLREKMEAHHVRNRATDNAMDVQPYLLPPAA